MKNYATKEQKSSGMRRLMKDNVMYRFVTQSDGYYKVSKEDKIYTDLHFVCYLKINGKKESNIKLLSRLMKEIEEKDRTEFEFSIKNEIYDCDTAG